MTPYPCPCEEHSDEAIPSAYGKTREMIVLFGSRARGDHRPDSNYALSMMLSEGSP